MILMVLALSLAPASEPVLRGAQENNYSCGTLAASYMIPFLVSLFYFVPIFINLFFIFSLFSIHFAFLFETEYTTTDVSVEAGGHGDFIKSGVISPIAEKVRPVNYRG